MIRRKTVIQRMSSESLGTFLSDIAECSPKCKIVKENPDACDGDKTHCRACKTHCENEWIKWVNGFVENPPDMPENEEDGTDGLEPDPVPSKE